jgi:hypothetical protein
MTERRYAEATKVSSEASRAEIERVVRRYGATKFVSGWEEERAVIGFVVHGRQVRLILPLPSWDDFATKTSRVNQNSPYVTRQLTRPQQEKAHEQASRQSWRALLLIIRAKLEAVEAGIVTFETEFLPHFVLGDGHTVAEHVEPALAAALDSGTVPDLLPRAITGGSTSGRGHR